MLVAGSSAQLYRSSPAEIKKWGESVERKRPFEWSKELSHLKDRFMDWMKPKNSPFYVPHLLTPGSSARTSHYDSRRIAFNRQVDQMRVNGNVADALAFHDEL